MESLVGAKYFSTMDLKSGFWQVKVSEDSHQYTAFTVSSMGVYEFLRMPYGLCNTPVTFQHLMQNCLGELNLSFAMVYLDDVIVYSETPEDHLTWLQAIFNHFAHHGLKLELSKCYFFKEEITYLCHEISAKGMLPWLKGVEEIAWMAPPTTYIGVRKFCPALKLLWGHWHSASRRPNSGYSRKGSKMILTPCVSLVIQCPVTLVTPLVIGQP